jgi:shikimate kinase
MLSPTFSFLGVTHGSLEVLQQMNIVLIGYRCTGKTAVGKILARELGRSFLDTDRLVEEETGSSVKGLVSAKGWDHFREMEKLVVEKITKGDNLVIATGGGVVMDGENVAHLKRNGWIVWLKADAALIKERMEREERSGTIRPSLTGSDPIEEIDRVLSSRASLYGEAADLTVDTSTCSPREVADLVMKALPLGVKGEDE